VEFRLRVAVLERVLPIHIAAPEEMHRGILLPSFAHSFTEMRQRCRVWGTDGNEPELSKNEPNQNLGLLRTQQNPNPKVKHVQKPNQTEPYPAKKRTEPEPKRHGS